MTRRSLGAILAAAALGVAALGVAPPAAAQTAVKLGLLTSMTGPAASTGEDQRRAAALAVDEINAAGGVQVREANAKLKLQLVIGDDQTSREGAVSAVTRLLVEDKVQVVFGGLGSAFGMAALPQIREHAVPYIPTPSTPLFTRTPEMEPDPTKSMVFHYQATGLTQGATIADFLVKVIKPPMAANRPLRVAWMYQDSPFGAELYRGFAERVKDASLAIAARGGGRVEIVAAERFRVGETDYRSLLTKIKGLNPDVLVPQGFRGETVAAVQQAVVDVGFDLKKTHIGPVCACADDPLYYKDLGKIGQGTTILSLYSTYAIPKGGGFAKWAAFRKAYQDKYGTLPGLLGVSAYDVVHVAAKAIERAGSLDRKKIIEALGQLEMDQIVLAMQGGKIRFDPKYHEAAFVLFVQQMAWDEQLKELRPRIIWPVELAEGKYKQP